MSSEIWKSLATASMVNQLKKDGAETFYQWRCPETKIKKKIANMPSTIYMIVSWAISWKRGNSLILQWQMKWKWAGNHTICQQSNAASYHGRNHELSLPLPFTSAKQGEDSAFTPCYQPAKPATHILPWSSVRDGPDDQWKVPKISSSSLDYPVFYDGVENVQRWGKTDIAVYDPKRHKQSGCWDLINMLCH